MCFEDILKRLYYHKLNIQFYPEDDIYMPFWGGAVWRNRFLYFAEMVFDEDGVSLLEHIDSLTIGDSHPFYDQFKGGFPKGFLFDCSEFSCPGGHLSLYRRQVYGFSLILIGKCSVWLPLFVKALRLMFMDGVGEPKARLNLIDIEEDGSDVLCGRSWDYGAPKSPIHFTNVMSASQKTLSLHLITPVRLTNCLGKGCSNDGHQGRLNNFPSLYQMMRSVAFRLLTLCMLYTEESVFMDWKELDDCVEEFVKDTKKAFLLSANISWEIVRSTPKKGSDKVYVMNGYCGKLVFGNVESRYYPVLEFASCLGVGNDISYGLGMYEIVI